MTTALMDRPASGRRTQRRYLHVAILLAILGLLLLLDGLVRGRDTFDYQLIDAVQRLDLPRLDSVFSGLTLLTSWPALLAVWLAALLFLSLVVRTWLPALVVGAVPLGWLATYAVGTLAGWSSPDPARLERPAADAGAATLIALQESWLVLLYGTIFFLAGRIINRVLRWLVRVATLAIVALAGLARVWLGEGWVLDVIAAYALGGAMLLILYWAYLRIDAAVGEIPFIHAVEIPHDEDQPHAHALTSTILFRDGKAIKVYAPGFVPRAVYWLAFQAEFPYMRNRAALNAAVLRRNLAGRLTEYWYGDNRVARALGIVEVGDRYGLVSEFIEESEDEPDPEEAEAFLFDLDDHFDAAGLPTWQIDARQPRGKDNVLRGHDGRFHIIDLESGLVSPLASLRSWWRAIRRADFPLFDTVFFDTTRRYVDEREAQMRERMGDEWLAETRALVDRAEAAKDEWHATEPRIWSRALAIFWGGLGIERQFRRGEDLMDRGQNRAEEWILAATSTWEEDGRISADEARGLRDEVATPRFHHVLPHFGVHLTIGIFARFPVGSTLRAGYTLLQLLWGTVKLTLRRIDRGEWRERFSIHSPLVILIAGVPGIGTFSYLASGPIRSNHLLIRLALDTVLVKIPYRIYERFGWRALVAPSSKTERRAMEAASDVLHLGGLGVRPSSVAIWAIATGAVFVVVGVLIHLADFVVTPGASWWPDLVHLFNADYGDALINWYQGALAIASALALLLTSTVWLRGRSMLAPLAGVALIILAPLFDEHMPERFELTSVFKRAVTGRFDDPADWFSVTVAVGLVMLLVSMAIWFLREVPVYVRGIFLVGVMAYLGGAIGAEILTLLYRVFVSHDGLIREILAFVEEGIELSGLVMLLYATLEYARWSQREPGVRAKGNVV